MPIIIPLSTKGEITIPEKVRKHLQINSGDCLYFEIINSEIHVQKVKTKLYIFNNKSRPTENKSILHKHPDSSGNVQ